MSEREEVLREFGERTNGDTEYAMADEIVRLRRALAARDAGAGVLEQWCEKIATVNAKYEDAKAGNSQADLDNAEYDRYELLLQFQHWWEDRALLDASASAAAGQEVTEANVAAARFVCAAIDSHCTAQWWQDSDVQDELENHGLLEAVTVEEPCGGAECECQTGVLCYRVTALAKELRALAVDPTQTKAAGVRVIKIDPTEPTR